MRSAIKNRRSVRKFTGESVSDETVDAVLEAGRWAPSGLNNQPWRFAVIRDPVLKEQMSSLTRYGAIVSSADVLIAVFYDTLSGYDRTKDHQAIGACIQNMLLAIHDLSLGGVWLGEILKSSAEVKELLGSPEQYEFMALIACGYPDGKLPSAPVRKMLSELVFFRR